MEKAVMVCVLPSGSKGAEFTAYRNFLFGEKQRYVGLLDPANESIADTLPSSLFSSHRIIGLSSLLSEVPT